MKIRQIEQRLQEIIEESEKEIKKICMSHQSLLEELSMSFKTYFSRIKSSKRVGNIDETGSIDDGLRGIGTGVYPLNNAAYHLKQALESIYHKESSYWYERKARTEKVLKNLQKVFGTKEFPISDVQNRINCLNDEDFWGNPRHPWLSFIGEGFYHRLSKEGRGLLKERKMNASESRRTILHLYDNPYILPFFRHGELDVQSYKEWLSRLESLLLNI